MLEQFTADAQHLIVTAHTEARLHGHDHVGTEHVLLAALQHPTIAETFATAANITHTDTKSAFVNHFGRNDPTPESRKPAFTGRLRRALADATIHAARSGTLPVTAEHVTISILNVDAANVDLCGESSARRFLHATTTLADEAIRTITANLTTKINDTRKEGHHMQPSPITAEIRETVRELHQSGQTRRQIATTTGLDVDDVNDILATRDTTNPVPARPAGPQVTPREPSIPDRFAAALRFARDSTNEYVRTTGQDLLTRLTDLEELIAADRAHTEAQSRINRLEAELAAARAELPPRPGPTPTRNRASRPTVTAPAGKGTIPHATVRAWAVKNNIPVGKIGRVPQHVIDQYVTATAGKAA